MRSYLVRLFQPDAVTARRCGRDQIPRALGETGDERFALRTVFVYHLTLCCRHEHDPDLQASFRCVGPGTWSVSSARREQLFEAARSVANPRLSRCGAARLPVCLAVRSRAFLLAGMLRARGWKVFWASTRISKGFASLLGSPHHGKMPGKYRPTSLTAVSVGISPSKDGAPQSARWWWMIWQCLRTNALELRPRIQANTSSMPRSVTERGGRVLRAGVAGRDHRGCHMVA